MSSGTVQSTAGNGGAALGAEAADHERQFRELLDFCPAALSVVDEDGHLLFHNARLAEILGYSKDELHRCDTRMLRPWHHEMSLRRNGARVTVGVAPPIPWSVRRRRYDGASR